MESIPIVRGSTREFISQTIKDLNLNGLSIDMVYNMTASLDPCNQLYLVGKGFVVGLAVETLSIFFLLLNHSLVPP